MKSAIFSCIHNYTIFLGSQVVTCTLAAVCVYVYACMFVCAHAWMFVCVHACVHDVYVCVVHANLYL